MERLKITAHLKWGQVIYNDDFYFDAILYATKMKHTMSNYYNRERKQVNSKGEQMELPLKRHTNEILYSFNNQQERIEHTNKESGVRLTSRAIVTPLGEQQIIINKRFQSLRYEKRGGIEKKKVYLSMGRYKNYQVRRKVMLTPTVSRIVIGERGEINKMLNKVSHIGKECNIGYGRVEHRTIEPTEALGCRHFPSRHFAPYEIREHKRCLPPYSSKEHLRECSKRWF